MTDFSIQQHPEPGLHLLKTRGDTITLTLSLTNFYKGGAWVRTNLGHIQTIRRQIIRAVTHDEPLLGREWYDIPMKAIDDRSFEIKLPLCEVGHFEAKCFFLPSGEFTPLWPPGDNLTVNVAPTDTCCGNIIYNAFVRQFGPNKDGSFCLPEEKKDEIRQLDDTGYTVIPPSGTFRDLIAELDFIIDDLGCRIIHLLPVNPTPTTYGRMGRFGSPYASLDFTGIDPALARFDPKATPLEQFIELLDAVHARNAKLILDIAPNHTGWAAEIHETHPHWLIRDESGYIERPGAWGVIWEDLVRLDYQYKDLWVYMGEVFLTWCRRGVDGFRCDAGYMIPVWAWMYIISAVREEFPETIFFLEGLGGKMSVTRDLLNRGGFDWAYSELFQNYTRAQIEHYLPEPMQISEGEGLMVHFAETHDNNRLAATSKRFAALRTALCALCSHHGGFGFANGVEWFADEKIDVHNAKSLNWGSSKNQVDQIRRINRLLKTHPAFFDNTDIRMIQTGETDTLVFFRHHRPSGQKLLILVNLDTDQPNEVCWPPREAGIKDTVYRDLLSDQHIEINASDQEIYTVSLAPAQVYCLSPTQQADSPGNTPGLPKRIARQRLQAAALEVFRVYHGTSHLGGLDPDSAADALASDPIGFCRQMNPAGDEARVIPWQWPADCRRRVMIPAGHLLMIEAPRPFRARIIEQTDNGEKTRLTGDALCRSDGMFFTLFPPLPSEGGHMHRTLKLSMYNGDGYPHTESGLLYLAAPDQIYAQNVFNRSALKQTPLKFLSTNGRGAMMRAHAAWSQISSKYDGLLAANLNPDYPDDRQIMLSRCRAWLVFQGYSQDLGIECQEQFWLQDAHRGTWRFTIPCGQGQHVTLLFTARMIPDENQTAITIYRQPAGQPSDRLPDDKPVRLIIRPDIDDRNFHENTKAFMGPEHHFPNSCRLLENGFEFAPDPTRKLLCRTSAGDFVWEPEWQYMVYLPVEADRSMDPHTDLFSPGYFSIYLNGGQTVNLTAGVNTEPAVTSSADSNEGPTGNHPPDEAGAPFESALKDALKAFVVRRGTLHTIIAGYPWFLDWGRDTLIVIRGLIAAGYLGEAEAILMQFASFEENGTLPNMIRGSDASNRDTSDAPLWFFVACDDLINALGDNKFLEKSCGNRRIIDVLAAIASGYINGTRNGIRMDDQSGLIYSPSHFTWMDTNHPAGSPRQGYPVEIQALWHFALRMLDRLGEQSLDWHALAEKVRSAIEKLFIRESDGYLSDCLHAESFVPAAQAAPDDALRPNQLFAVTLGAVTDQKRIRTLLDRCMELLVPGAIRSLADRPLNYPLEIRHNGRLLNDPHHPYQGVYAGDEDTQRKPAYHNGTAWTWVFPAFCEAWAIGYGGSGTDTALSWLSSSSTLLNAGCTGQIPEIIDGDAPHAERGCDAQAWGVSELLRVWRKLTYYRKESPS